MNDSWEKNCHHIQSFFLAFTPQILNHSYFKKFIDRIGIIKDKEELILRYEVGLGARTTGESIELNPLYPFEDISRHCSSLGNSFQFQDWVERGPFNTTIFAWDVLLDHFRYPFDENRGFKAKQI